MPQAKAAREWAAELEQRLTASETSSAGRIEELEGVISVLNAQLDEASSHTDHSDQESFYSHFDGRAIFGGGNFWLQDSGLCPAGGPVGAKPSQPSYEAVAPSFGIF